LNKPELTAEDRYRRGYMEGLRIGRVCTLRGFLIHLLERKWKENMIVPNKTIIQRINRETDSGFLEKILFSIFCDELSVRELESSFDMIFRTEEEIRNEEYTVYS